MTEQIWNTIMTICDECGQMRPVDDACPHCRERRSAPCWICDRLVDRGDLEFFTDLCGCLPTEPCEHGLCPSYVEALICVLIEEAHGRWPKIG